MTATATNLAKLTDKQVLTIRWRYAHTGLTQKGLAAQYGVAQQLVSSIVRGERWPHLPLYPHFADLI